MATPAAPTPATPSNAAASAEASPHADLPTLSSPPEPGRPPKQVLASLWLFAPNRDTRGGSAWWLDWPDAEGSRGVLVDCPAFTEANLAFLHERGPGLIVLTSREGHGRTRRFQEALGWPVLVQEQEAYLLPGVRELQPFGSELALAADLRLLWTPGPTPGASVLLAGDELLFCGRLLSPTGPNQAAPLRTSRSFHWGRWQRSMEQLRRWLPAHQPRWLACGSGLGALRGASLITPARPVLDGLSLQAGDPSPAV